MSKPLLAGGGDARHLFVEACRPLHCLVMDRGVALLRPILGNKAVLAYPQERTEKLILERRCV